MRRWLIAGMLLVFGACATEASTNPLSARPPIAEAPPPATAPPGPLVTVPVPPEPRFQRVAPGEYAEVDGIGVVITDVVFDPCLGTPDEAEPLHTWVGFTAALYNNRGDDIDDSGVWTVAVASFPDELRDVARFSVSSCVGDAGFPDPFYSLWAGESDTRRFSFEVLGGDDVAVVLVWQPESGADGVEVDLTAAEVPIAGD